MPADATPVQFFELIMTDEVVGYIVDETNMYAQEAVTTVRLYLTVPSFLCNVHNV